MYFQKLHEDREEEINELQLQISTLKMKKTSISTKKVIPSVSPTIQEGKSLAKGELNQRNPKQLKVQREVVYVDDMEEDNIWAKTYNNRKR